MLDTTTSPDAPPSESPAEALCANCGALLVGPYCAQCGQRAEGSLSVRGLLSDVLEDQLSVSGSAAATVLPLLFRPGFLTQEYLRGRIVRYAAPFRVFLVSTTLFLLAFTFSMHVQQPIIERTVRAGFARERARQAERERIALLAASTTCSLAVSVSQ